MEFHTKNGLSMPILAILYMPGGGGGCSINKSWLFSSYFDMYQSYNGWIHLGFHKASAL